jgi:DNA-binding response OmpR family regulator
MGVPPETPENWVYSWHSRYMTVLLVEDDRAIADAVIEGLRGNGYDVRHVVLGSEAIAKVRAGGVSTVILDLGLPDMDGTEVCRLIRSFSHVPIIVVSARETEMDRVTVLDMGADDYVVKPFGIKELVARIHAVMRRATGSVAPITHIEVGSLIIDTKTRTVALNTASVALTPKEFDLLAYLAREPGTAFRRADILRDVWQTNWYGTTKTLDAHVASIRKKLGDPKWIESVRGVGFTVRRVS